MFLNSNTYRRKPILAMSKQVIVLTVTPG